MLRTCVTALLVFSLAVAAANAASPAQSRFSAAARAVAEQRAALWECQDSLALPRTRASVSVWGLPRSLAYRRWAAGMWGDRARACKAAASERLHVIRRIDRGLHGTPMAGTGVYFEKHGRRHRVSPYFMAAVAATESSLGHAACANNRFNVWGLSSCGPGWYVPAFRSWDEAIGFYARFLSSRWPTASTTYSYRGYAACSDCWGRKTAYWMQRLFGVGHSTRYPL